MTSVRVVNTVNATTHVVVYYTYIVTVSGFGDVVLYIIDRLPNSSERSRNFSKEG